MRTLLFYTTTIQNNNLVAFLDGFQSMGDYECRSWILRLHFVERSLDGLIINR
jgi:hypothetical protein